MRGTGAWQSGELWGRRGGEVGDTEQAATRVDRVLRRLRDLARRSNTAVRAAPGGGADTIRFLCSLNEPAAPDAIAEAELRLGMALPADYTRFLLMSDGATLSADATSPPHTGAELLGTEALVLLAEEMEYDYRAGCIPELVIFASVGDEGDHLAFETGRMNPYGGCAVLDARHDCRPDLWWVIAPDFTDWLDRLLKDIGPPGSFGRHWQDSELQPCLPLADDSGPV